MVCAFDPFTAAGSWELRGSPKHGVSRELYDALAPKQEVREGTHLSGTACLVTKYDTGILFQHHLARLWLADRESLQPALFMARDREQGDHGERRATLAAACPSIGSVPAVRNLAGHTRGQAGSRDVLRPVNLRTSDNEKR